MRGLGKRTKTGTLNPDNPVHPGGWTVAFGPDDIGVRVAAEVYHIAVTGPIGSSFEVYLDTTFYDSVARGDRNSWDPNQAMVIEPGTVLYFHYNTALEPAPKVSIFLREPSAL